MLTRYRTHIVLLILFNIPLLLRAQDTFIDSVSLRKISAKLPPALIKTINNRNSTNRSTQTFLVELSDTTLFYRHYRDKNNLVQLVKTPLPGLVIVRCKTSLLIELIQKEFVRFAEPYFQTPNPEGNVVRHDLSVNAIHAAQQTFPHLKGIGEVVSVKENRMDSQDIDLVNRFVFTGVESSIGSTHATTMTTLICGVGNSSPKGKGVATGSFYASSDFSGALPDGNDIYRSSSIRIQNHSYGTAIQSYYGANARAFDLSVEANPFLTHVFSSGNSGLSVSTEGKYKDIAGFANLTGNMKMAKNVLVVGAIDSNGIVSAASSKGPAYDGRIKPDLVAFAEDGSSGSAALMSGAVAVLQDTYKQQFNENAGSDIVRAVLINSADESGTEGPDFISGYGNMNLFRSVQTVMDNRLVHKTILPISEDEVLINVPPGATNLKVTLVWNDPASAALSTKALINDLDLIVEQVSSGQTFQSWILSVFPHRDSLLLPARKGRDSLNNVEQVSISSPIAGEYKVKIKSGLLQGGNQPYAIVWEYKTMGSFQWMYPSLNTQLEAGVSNMLRWESAFPPATTGKLEWSTDSITWNLLEIVTDVSEQSISWSTPVAISNAWLRMIIEKDTFTTAEFMLNSPTVVRVGYRCDSTLVYWNNPLHHTLWRLFSFDGFNLVPVKETSDTSVVLQSDPGLYVAVAPVIDGKVGLKGPTENVSQSGVGCYINNFLADLIDDKEVQIKATLGTVYGVQEVIFEKIGFEIKEIYKSSTGIMDVHEFVDSHPTNGANLYRVKVKLSDGKVIYSAVNTVYYTGSSTYTLYPVPAVRGSVIKLLQKQANDIYVQITDATGRIIHQQFFSDTYNEIDTDRLPKGLYILKITDEQGIKKLYRIILI